MQIATGANMLNFGYWDENTSDPHHAQIKLCKIFSKMAELENARDILDIGSGFSEPAIIWQSEYPHLRVVCSDINSNQLKFAKNLLASRICPSVASLAEPSSADLVNSSATKLPFLDKSFDRVIALESAQHFKPFDRFVTESRRVLKDKGLLVLAIPVVSKSFQLEILKLGILSFTWSSEHYEFMTIKETVTKNGFEILQVEFIGSKVFAPLANYYIKHREHLRPRILQKYPNFVEKVLFKSMLKMKKVSESGIIDYVLLKCRSKN